MGDVCRRMVTFGGLDFCCQKFSKDVMAFTEDSGGGATLPRRWQQHVRRHL